MKKHRVTLPDQIHHAALEGRVALVAIKAKKEPGAVLDLKTGEEVRECVFAQCPYAVGDLLACRESVIHYGNCYCYPLDNERRYTAPKSKYKYADNVHLSASRMPLSAVRLWLRVTSVRACRVSDVTIDEAKLTGIYWWGMESPRHNYEKLWNSRRGHSFDSDWCWLLGVERQEAK